ncbi:MFS transporter [Kutzneria albida]|uniref:Major facilitator superfamily (MFS) profile domain-containing protein n=1 Tax=Kutzneria albida DSM 43870 TaxID=1449976 RepID=W5W8I1_9PSEU|nr:MFS transporter [Kutzneria albida]AHH97443.1 hypothetical protein KALB_4079 [Kutzneria albida DSM 43870]
MKTKENWLTAWSVLRERTFRRFFIGEATSLLGDGMTAVALSFAVLDLTGSASDLGFVLAARAVPMVATLLIGGVMADRFPRRRIMVTADLVRFASQGTVAVLLLSGDAQIWQLAALQAVQGMASAAFDPASAGLVPSLLSGELLQQANGLRGMAFSGGGIAGPALAGLLVALSGPGWAIAVDAATFGVSALMLSVIPIERQLPTTKNSFTHDLREGWSEFRGRTWLWMTVASSSLGNLLLSWIAVLGPLLAKRDLGGPAAWASMNAVLGVGLFVGGMVAMHVHSERPLRTGILALTIGALPTLGLALQLPLLLLCALAFVAGIGVAIFSSVWATTLQRNIPGDKLSRVNAYANFGSVACQPIGQALVGPVAAAIGVYSTLWLAAGIQLLSAMVALSTPAIRKLPAEAEVTPTEVGTRPRT